MAFTLPPEPTDREVTITIPAAVDPYFKQWYLATRKAGETPEAFAYRNLAKAGIAYRAHQEHETNVQAIKDIIDALQAEKDAFELNNNLL